jgi:hypothetical protein
MQTTRSAGSGGTFFAGNSRVALRNGDALAGDLRDQRLGLTP